MEISEAIRKRRSIRAFKTTPLSQHELDTVLEAGRLAPSWANTQTWRWVVVRDNDIKTQIAERALRPGNRGTDALKNAPVTIAAFAELNKAGFRDGKPSTDKDGYWYMFDAALALENMALTATSIGLGTLFIGGMNSKEVEKILKSPPGYTCVILMILGHPDEDPEARPRKDISELAFTDLFSEK